MLLAGLIALSGRILAQSDTTFALRELSSQYDATGYLTGSTPIQIDGRLIVSEGSGSVIYRYPISSFTKHGYPITVELNYCGSVNHTTFSKYTTFGNVPGFGDTKQAWGRFDQNRPLWLLSVNGMAVQSLSVTTAFHARPDLVNNDFDKNKTSRTTFSDADVPWCIDGLDYSNRMKSLSMGIDNEARNAYDYVDVIRLLKGDGSVLELRNSYAAKNAGLNVSYFNDSLFTGYYHTNSANDPTYAFVELDSAARPPFFPDTSATYLHVLQPRRLHLFKGDGTEMVYVEQVIPYGTRDYRSVLEPYGGMLAGPTIFYLEEINSTAGQLLSIKRSRHNYDGSRIAPVPEGVFYSPGDSTRGRALVTEFDGHRITYGYNHITIQALGRTTEVVLNDVVGSGGASETSGVPFPTLGYPARLALDQAALGLTSSQNYQSWTGYVTAIIDPEGRSTTFEYEQVLRRYLNSGFPYMPGTGTVQFNLRNLRLKQITEPTTRYIITYNAAKPSPETGDFGETDWIPIKSKAYGLSETKEPWILNDQVRKVEKYDCSGLLLTDDYTFTGQGGTITSSTHWTTDAKDSSVRARRWVYQFDNLPDVLPSLPRGRNTRVVESADSCTGFVKLTRTTFDTLTPWIILPKLTTESINGIDKTRIRHEYTIGPARSFGGDTALANAYGRDITQRSERAECACDTATADAIHPGIETTVTLSHLAEATATVGTTGMYDEAASKRRYDSLYGGSPNPPDWDAVKFSPAVAVYRTTGTYTAIAPPISGLQTQRITSGGSTFLRTTRDYSNGTDIDTVHIPRGLALTDKIAGQIGGRYMDNRLTRSRSYSHTAGRWLATSTTDGFGARGEQDWSFTPRIGRIITDRDGLHADTLAGNEFFATAFELPTVERALVRKPTPSGTVRTDTLTTISDRTFYGLAARVIDPNGWVSQYHYDTLGRLQHAWLPLDFPARGTIDTFTVTGYRAAALYGVSIDTTWRDTMICKPNPSRAVVVPSWQLNRQSGTLVINNPPVITADCDNCVGIYGKAAGKGGDRSTTLATCNELPWLYHTPSIIYLSSGIRPPGTTAITTLDSAWLDLLITREFDGCMNAIVEIPQFNFSRTYVFGCPPSSGNGSITSGGPSGAPSGAFAILPEVCEQALTALDSAGPGKRWRINLTNLRDSLKAVANRGGLLTVKIRTSTSGASMEISSDIYADYRPRLMLKGAFSSYNATGDGTLAYTYQDSKLTTITEAKVDDSRHTANSLTPSGGGTASFMTRTTRKQYQFGGDYRVRKTKVPVGDWLSPTRIDSTTDVHNGLGKVTSAVDADGDVVLTRYDALGRLVEVTNTDGTKQRIAYFYGTDSSFGLPPMKSRVRVDCFTPVLSVTPPCDTTYEYACPFVSATRITDETGVKTWRYFDSYDRLRREVVDSGGSGHLNLTTLYDYDELGRPEIIINPKGDTTRYVYDPLGRMRFKGHPDLGVVSFGYDRGGRLRFSQSQEQADSGRLTFTEYDDLSRPTLIGEATISGSGGGITIGGGTGKRNGRSAPLHVLDSAGFARLTDSLDGDQIYTGLSGSSTPTVNPSIYLTPTGPIPPAVPPLSQFDSVTCPLPKNLMLGETALPAGPFIKHPVAYYEPVTTPAAPRSEFENVTKYPHFVRQVVSYDTFPDRAGAVWSTIPTRGRWDSLAPTGKLRNLKGHEVAIAYREHGGEPFHYVVMSFDERGRPEMLARWTENLGFDAVYYTYNSINQATSIRVADPIRQYVSWYGHDWNGRIDTVWSELGPVWSGLGVRAPRYPAPLARPTTPDIVYSYRKGGQISRVRYPPVDATIDYAYSKRKWLDSISAYMITPPPFPTVAPVFKEVLSYDAAGQIIGQRSRHMSDPENTEIYRYDSVRRLVGWVRNTDSVWWSYDAAANRTNQVRRLPFVGLRTESYSRGGTTAGGSNRLSDIITQDTTGAITGLRSFSYNANGSRTGTTDQQVPGGPILSEDHLAYSYRELTRQYVSGNPAGTNRLDWRYRYNSGGEREAKRLYYGPAGDEGGNAYPWVYYLLGGRRVQLAVYHGQQTLGACGDGSRQVYLYPSEYLTYSRQGSLDLVFDAFTSEKEFRVNDHLGSARAMIRPSGITSADYSPFGGALTTGAPRKGWIGKENDPESGLADLSARKLDTAAGEFPSADPWWEKYRGTSPYAYSFANPLRISDPSGLGGGTPGEEAFDPDPMEPTDGPFPAPPQGQVPPIGGGSFGAGTAGTLIGGALNRLGVNSPEEFTERFSNSVAVQNVWSQVTRVVNVAKGLWDKMPFVRGVEAEGPMGQNLPKNFPTFDRFANGVATSIKTIDLRAFTYQNMSALSSTIRGYLNAVAGFTNAQVGNVRITSSMITQRVLDIGIPYGQATEAQKQTLLKMMVEAQKLNITVRITELK